MTSRGRPPDGGWRRRLASGAGLTLLIALMTMWIAPAASAHSDLVSSSPDQGARLTDSPAVVVLHFSEPVGISTDSLLVLDQAGRRVEIGEPVRSAGDPSTVQVALPPALPRASYAVRWRVVSADGHPASGTFAFGIGVPAGTTLIQVAPAGLAGWLHGLAWWASYLGAVLLVGVPFFLLVVWPGGMHEPRLRRLVRAGWRLSLAAAVAGFLLQGPYGAGASLAHVADPGLIEQTLSGRVGLLLLFRAFVLGLAVAAGPWPGSEALPALRRNGAGLAVLFLPTFSLLGHSGEGSLAAAAVISDCAHLAAASLWLGGIAALLVTSSLPPAADGPLAAESPGQPGRGTGPRWSAVAMIAVSVLVITGTFQAWRELPGPGALPATGYGQLLLAKLALAATLAGLGDQGRRGIRRLASSIVPQPVRRLRAVLVAELVVGATVLALTSALVGTVPPDRAPRPRAAVPYSDFSPTTLRTRGL